MPIELERKLKRQARKKGFGKERTGAYVYGTLQKVEEKKKKHNPGNYQNAYRTTASRKIKLMRERRKKRGA